jgi:dihydroxy-acid dehydratase
VFEDINDLAARVDDPELEVDQDSVMVLQNAGPVGAPGMPEWGHLPIPAKLLKGGVTDLLRISDARMSGTSYGSVVLHVAPESAIGGPLALVRTGDRIRLDVEQRTLDALVDDAELERRRSEWTPPPPKDERGYRQMYEQHVLQANEGCDLDFLRGQAAVVTDSVSYL